MSNISVELVLATRPYPHASNGLVTFVLEVPLFVWVELLTHKRLARNAASARAMSVKRTLGLGYYEPDVFYTQGSGMMSSNEPIADQESAHELWRDLWAAASHTAQLLQQLGVAREQANRVLPSFRMVRGVVTATEDAWAGFLELRQHPAADKAMQECATSLAQQIQQVDWTYARRHIPFSPPDSDLALDTVWNMAAACIARSSYGTNSETATDLDRAERLKADKHYSPFEHIAIYRLNPLPSALCSKAEDLDQAGQGWTNYRSLLEHPEL